jgi:hypothetical protein
MSCVEVIKQGIKSVNRNWQLVLVQFASTFIGFMSFCIIVGVPIAIAFILFGLDLTEILKSRDTLEVLGNSASLLKKYFAAAVIILLSLLGYLTFLVTLWTFTVSGTIGVFADSILSSESSFSLGSFIRHGRKYFMPVMFFSVLIGGIFMVIAFALGVLGGVAASIIETAKSREIAFALFLGVFFMLTLGVAFIFLILGTFSATIYGMAFLVFNKASSIEALKGSFRYLHSTPSAAGFYAVLMFSYGLALFLVLLIGSPIAVIPLIGPPLSMMYQLIVYFVQAYIGLVLISSAFIYYYNTSGLANEGEKDSHAPADPLPEEVSIGTDSMETDGSEK